MAPPIIPDEVARIIVLTRGLMEARGRYWCYVAVKPSRHKEFQQACRRKYNIQHFADDGYGEVIVSGRGAEPPPEVTQQVAQLFGISAGEFFTDADPDATLAEKLAALPPAQEG